MFQQDGARCHTAATTSKWLKEHQVEKFPHPAASPDMSPIEPLWNTLKNKIRARPHTPTSLDELKVAIQEAWGEITDEDINVHVRSMHQRTLDVIAANGGHTLF